MIQMTYDNVAQRGDLVRTGGGNLIDDLDLETAVLISIFTERRVEDGDEFSDTTGYKGGYWGDATEDIQGDKIGSRMWLLKREKATLSNVNQARVYIEESLAWMLEDGVAETVVVTTSRGVAPVDLNFTVEILRPNELEPWARTWEIQLNDL